MLCILQYKNYLLPHGTTGDVAVSP